MRFKDHTLYRIPILSFFFILILLSCGDAPRHNILDPQNINYKSPPKSPAIDSLYFYSEVGIGGRNKIKLYLFVYINDSKNPIEELSVTNTLNSGTVRLNYIAEEEKYEIREKISRSFI